MEKIVLFVILGGLHIEMALYQMLGDWLEGSGWSSALVEANVTTPGRAQSMMGGGHVTRSRWAHQVTVATHSLLKRSAYTMYTTGVSNEDSVVPYDEWSKTQSERHPQFLYWSMTISLQLLVLQFVKALWQGNFDLYVEMLGKLIPWLFAMDRTHYSRWLPVHVRDVLQLKDTHPSIYSQFTQGHFAM